MNGKAVLVARVLEAVRQRALTNRLGQVTCDYPSHDGLAFGLWSCARCKAAV